MSRRLPLLVAVGGAAGASLRWAVGETVDVGAGFPWATLLVNLIGCAVLGAVIAHGSDRTAALLGTGFCGGLTTFSTFAVEVVTLADDDRLGVATCYLVASLGLGVLAFGVTRRAARAVAAP